MTKNNIKMTGKCHNMNGQITLENFMIYNIKGSCMDHATL